ncbi:MAG: AAC(3) family N-acetyltransferase [Halolamina sp.]
MASHALRSLCREPWRGRSTVERTRPDALGEALSAFDADTVVVYAGLSAVAGAFGDDPYERLRDALLAQFDAVLTPGFTFSFRETGFVNLDRAPPEVGTFGRRFLADATFRTADPIFSLLGAGSVAFDVDGTTYSYAPGGYWTELHERDVCYLNVGTDRFRCSGFHVAEVRHDVPYISPTELAGRLVQHGVDRHVSHKVPTDNRYRRFARRKVCRTLGGALQDHSVGGVRIQGCRASAVDDLLDERLAADPYYLVT